MTSVSLDAAFLEALAEAIDDRLLARAVTKAAKSPHQWRRRAFGPHARARPDGREHPQPLPRRVEVKATVRRRRYYLRTIVDDPRACRMVPSGASK